VLAGCPEQAGWHAVLGAWGGAGGVACLGSTLARTKSSQPASQRASDLVPMMLLSRPEQCGLTKTDAAAQTLSGINPDVALEPYTMNITTVKGFEEFKESLTDPATGTRGVLMAQITLMM
jgi:hypothetical protein